MPRKGHITGRDRTFWARLGCLANADDVRSHVEGEVNKITRLATELIEEGKLPVMLRNASTQGGLLGEIRESHRQARVRLRCFGELIEQAEADHNRLHREYLEEAPPMCSLGKNSRGADGADQTPLRCSSGSRLVQKHGEYYRQLLVEEGWTDVADAQTEVFGLDRVLGSPGVEDLPAVASTLRDAGLSDQDIAILLLFHSDSLGGAQIPADGTDVFEVVKKKTVAVKGARAAYRKR